MWLTNAHRSSSLTSSNQRTASVLEFCEFNLLVSGILENTLFCFLAETDTGLSMVDMAIQSAAT